MYKSRSHPVEEFKLNDYTLFGIFLVSASGPPSPPPPIFVHINFFVLKYVSDDLESIETNFFFYQKKKTWKNFRPKKNPLCTF